MKHRKLRIAWSVAWGIAAGVLLVLWVRSNLFSDVISFASPTCDIIADSVSGGTTISIFFDRNREVASERHRNSYRHNAAMHPPNGTWKLDIHITRRGIDASLPHWFYLLLVSTIATAPWIHFSVRTFLVGTTLAAGLLGLTIYKAR